MMLDTPKTITHMYVIPTTPMLTIMLQRKDTCNVEINR